jgi:hypothetical protein
MLKIDWPLFWFLKQLPAPVIARVQQIHFAGFLSRQKAQPPTASARPLAGLWMAATPRLSFARLTSTRRPLTIMDLLK